jgi:hypothetical protein
MTKKPLGNLDNIFHYTSKDTQIWGFHSDEYYDYGYMRCDTTQSGSWVPNVIEIAASIFQAECNRFLPNVGSHLPMPPKNHDPDYRKSSETLTYNFFIFFNNFTPIQAGELGQAYINFMTHFYYVCQYNRNIYCIKHTWYTFGLQQYMLCNTIWYMLLVYFFYINVKFVQKY